jgi:hypothetical protein
MSTVPEAPIPPDADPIDRRVFWPSLVLGAAMAAWGVRYLLVRDVPLGGFTAWFLGALALHDLVLAPLVFAIGVGVGRVVGRRIRGAMQAGLIVAGGVLLYAVPALVGDGQDARDPSRLPTDYPLALAAVVAVIGVATGVAAARARRSRA